MGFWGTFVVHRDNRLLADLLSDIAAVGDAELCYDGVSGGWQVTRVLSRFDELPASFLADLRDLTGAPVLAADVLDSDAAFVTALGRHTSGWKAWLHLDAAIGYLAPPPAPFAEDGTYLGDDWSDPDYDLAANAVKEQVLSQTPGGAAAAAAAMAWASEAGLKPGTVEQVTAALDGHELFVEDLFFALLNRLGIATDKVGVPVRPAIVDLLRSRLGHHLDAVDVTSHRPERGERVAFRDMQDLRLHFGGQPTLTACGCGEVFSLRPAVMSDDAEAQEPHVDGWLANAVSELVGRPLTDAATIRHRYLPHLKGVVLRFGDRALFIAAIDGRWTVAKGSTPPQQLMNSLGPQRQDEIHVNPWLAK